jgi:hypothetical protein
MVFVLIFFINIFFIIKMLFSWIFTFKFYSFCQNGFYLDFIYKKYGEYFIRHILIYTSQFFGEKYLIEFFTKNIFKNLMTSLNKFFFVESYKFDYFFYNILISLLSLLSLLQLFIFFI